MFLLTEEAARTNACGCGCSGMGLCSNECRMNCHACCRCCVRHQQTVGKRRGSPDYNTASSNWATGLRDYETGSSFSGTGSMASPLVQKTTREILESIYKRMAEINNVDDIEDFGDYGMI